MSLTILVVIFDGYWQFFFGYNFMDIKNIESIVYLVFLKKAFNSWKFSFKIVAINDRSYFVLKKINFYLFQIFLLFFATIITYIFEWGKEPFFKTAKSTFNIN